MVTNNGAQVLALPEEALDHARAAWEAGEYETVLDVLEQASFAHRDDRVDAILLRVRTLLLMRRFAEIPALLDMVRDEIDEPEDALRVRAWRTFASLQVGDGTLGEAELDAVIAEAKLRTPTLYPELAYFAAQQRWAGQRLHEASAIVEDALPNATGAARSRLLQIHGWIALRREDHEQVVRSFTEALELLEESGETDILAHATIVVVLAAMMVETLDLQLGARVRREYSTLRWSSFVQPQRFETLHWLAWLSLLEGDVDRAWDERQQALTISPESGLHAKALIHAAHIADVVGDRYSRRRQLDLAASLLLRGEQLELDVERRMTLLAYASNADAAHLEQAERGLTLYSHASSQLDDGLALDGDRRIEAFEQFARGTVLAIQGEPSAITAFTSALENFERIGYRFRAALSAIELYHLTGEAEYAEAARGALEDAPHAWLHGVLESGVPDRNPYHQLTAAERRVLSELCKGKKAREIAETFRRSFNTVNNHTRRIFSVFNVHSRSALVAECARLGIMETLHEREREARYAVRER